jgi:hypothetical protein
MYSLAIWIFILCDLHLSFLFLDLKISVREKYEGHMSSSHGEPKRHSCLLCNKQFAFRSDMYKHRTQVQLRAFFLFIA